MTMLLPLAALAVVLLASDCAGLVQLPHHARGGHAFKALAHQHVVRSQDALWIKLPIDHFNNDSNTFDNKYFVDDSMFDHTATSPVCFFNMGGEGPVNGISADYVSELASRYKALVVQIEHRFYGDSVPNKDFSTVNLQYLTTRQALADAAALIDFLSEQYPNCCWFTFGGSYSGALSAWFRIKYPSKTRGSLSSSGVVNAILRFTGFDMQVTQAIGEECANKVRLITATFENAINAGRGAQAKALFGSPQDMEDPDFFYMMADSAAMADQYGFKANLCEAISALTPDTDDANIMATFANFTIHLWGADFGSNCFYDSHCLKNDPKRWQPTSRAWRWQKCHELAYFQVAPQTDSLRSQLIDMKYVLQQCVEVFGAGTFPATSVTNLYYGGIRPNGTNIFFSDFSDDPWQRASMVQTISPSLPFSLVKCDGCGHCMDLHSPSNADPPALVQSRNQFESFLNQWLAN
jgi:pimeloyl-ACP methyl ester carboxylesterase